MSITIYEVEHMFEKMAHGWFAGVKGDYNDFEKALLLGDLKAMNAYMNRVALSTFSYFDTGKNISGDEPDRFYQGFVLGLMVDMQDRYVITSNREIGIGRYDVMLESKNLKQDEFFYLRGMFDMIYFRRTVLYSIIC